MLSQDNRIADYSIFQTEGLLNVNQVVFAHKNLIIGKNGSGKTRFLKALEREKRNQEKNKAVITLYFPEIQSFYNSTLYKLQEGNAENPEIYPYDLLFENEECSFYDFLKIMENDKGDFLENIVAVLSLKRTVKTTKAKQTLDELNDMLLDFLEKKIYIKQDENKIYVEKIEKDTVVRQKSLTEALSEFSPGELMLFYLCVFLMTIKRKSTNSTVLIIDEPELHLHPRALVKMIKTLMGFESVHELWIASHSLFLVPLFSFEEIVFIHQNKVVSRSSHTYKDLFHSLVGLENIDVFEFLKSLDNWQYYQFIVECFCLPEAVEKINVKDEQFCKLLTAIKMNMDSQPIQMLDYGAGKFRIWECMQLLPDSELGKNHVIYTAFEPYPENNKKRPFKLYTNIADCYHSQQRFHVIVLMNVLHEIEITQWMETFRNIDRLLMDNGVLIFLEVLSLTKGEQPYGNNGYLVLQDEQVKKLFGDDNIVNMRKNSNEKSNCWMITKKQVENVTDKTITDSITSLRDTSYCLLKKEFQKRIEYAHQNIDNQEKQMAARKYAFFSQQYINASLSIELHKSKVATKINKFKTGITINNNQSIEIVGLKNTPKE